jgi:peptide/nickel transport system permease protein
VNEHKNIGDEPKIYRNLEELTPEKHPELFETVGVKSTQIDIEWVEKMSFWSIVWAQLKKNKQAMFGLYCIFGLIFLATFAPVLSLDKPFFCYIEGEGWYFPWFKALFDRNFFENGVDIFFNLLLVLSPLYAFVLWYLYKTLDKLFYIHFLKIMGLFLASHLLLFAATMSPVGWYGVPPDYYGKIEEKIASDSPQNKVRALYPLRPFAFRNIDFQEINPRPPQPKFWFGTDKAGHDVFSLMLYGTRISLTIGVVAVSIYITIGIVLGAIAGFFGGKVDLVICRFIEIIICIPTFFLILALIAFVEKPSIFHIMGIIGITSWTTVARLVRGEFLRLRNMDYVQAAIALGFSKTRIIFGHVLPNALGPVLVSATFGVAASILIESALSFLGLGDVTAPSWGGVLTGGREAGKMWLILIPGIAIFFVVSVFNLVGEGLRDALDPKLRQ